MTKAWEIAAYVYAADIYCTDCIIDVLPTGEGEEFDGWALAHGVRMSTEDNLTEIAHAFGIDRNDESSFDSGEFPKVVFLDSLCDDGHDYCGKCHRDLCD